MQPFIYLFILFEIYSYLFIHDKDAILFCGLPKIIPCTNVYARAPAGLQKCFMKTSHLNKLDKRKNFVNIFEITYQCMVCMTKNK